MLIEFKSKIHSLVRLGLTLVLLALCISVVRNIYHLRRVNRRHQEAVNSLSHLQEEQKELTRQLSQIRTQEYFEREAHDRLGLVKEGEIVLILPEDEVVKKLSPRNRQNTQNYTIKPNWRHWLDLFL